MYQRHPLSAAFPTMSAEEQDALTADINQHGQRDPITIYDGQVLDGWHRYCACLTLDIKPTTVDYFGVDPVAFVLSRNMHRRNLTGSQRAAAVVACSEWAQVGKPKVNGEVTSPLATVPEMAKQAEVSERTIQQAKRATEAGLGTKVISGELSAEKAADMAKPKAEKPTVTEPVPEQPKPETVTILKEQYDEMKEMLNASLEEEKALANMLDAEPDARLAEATEQIKQLVEQLRLTKSSLDGANNANNELKRMLKSKDREIIKLTKELEGYRLKEIGL